MEECKMIYEKVKEVFAGTKEREVHGRFHISDELFIRYITANLVVQKLRYGTKFDPYGGEEIEKAFDPISMGEFTRRQTKDLNMVDESLFSTIARQNARIYNQLNPRTQREFQYRNEINKKDASFNVPIQIRNYQKEVHQLLRHSIYGKTKEETKAGTTIGQFERRNFKKIRIPHLLNAQSYYQNQMMKEGYTEREQIIHTYLIEKGLTYHYTSAFCRLLEQYHRRISEQDAIIYTLIANIPSFPIRLAYLDLYFQLPKLIQYWDDESFLNFCSELKSVDNLIEHTLIDYTEAGHYNVKPNDEDYTIFETEMDITPLQNVALAYKNKEAQQFNSLMAMLGHLHSQ